MSEENVNIQDLMAQSGIDLSAFENPLKKIHEFIFANVLKDGKLQNVFEDDKKEYRSFAIENGAHEEDKPVQQVLSPMEVVDDHSYQEVDFAKDGQKVVWLINHEGERHLLVQTGTDLEQLDQIEGYDISTVYSGSDVAYMLKFLTAFNSGETILIDEKEKKLFDEINEYVQSIIQKGHNPISQLLSSLLNGKENYKELLPSWEDAIIIDHENKTNNVITYGVTARTNDTEVLEHKVTRAVVWFKPLVQNVEGEAVDTEALSITTLFIPQENVPQFRPSNKINVTVEETLPEGIKAVLVIHEDVLEGGLTGCELYRTEDFDITKTI